MTIALRPTLHARASGATSSLAAGLRLLVTEGRVLFALDAFVLVLLAVAVGPFLASVLRHSDSAMAMAAILDDDALISMQLDGMTSWPWGNPANFLDEKRSAGMLPPHWGTLSYTNLPYYGGLYLDLAFLLWVPLKLLGLPFFPTGPIILRVLAHLFTALFLLAGYNLLRVHFGRLTAVLATLFIASEYWLYQIGAKIHPDSLLFLLMLVQLHLCIRHAQAPRAATLVALAVVAGLAQGAKMGGPALVPLTVMALAIARREVLRGQGALRWVATVLRDGFAAAAIALVVFFLTTPYALLDSYFLRTWMHWAKVFSGTSPISPTTFQDWWAQASGHVGAAMLALAAAGVAASVLLRAGRERWIPGVLLLCLGLTVFFYYALFQKYWVQLQYLVVAFWVLGAVAALGIGLVVDQVPRTGRIAAAAAVLAAGLALFATRYTWPLFDAFLNLHWRESPQYAIGAWAQQNLPRKDRTSLVSDAPTYFPTSVVADYAFLAHPVRYLDLATRLPDYFLLTRYSGNWQAAKITTTRHEPWDAEIYNMRLYQDLLGSHATELEIGKSLPFAQHLHSAGSSGRHESILPCVIGRFNCAAVTPERIGALYEAARHATAHARHVSLYRLDKEKLMAQVPESLRMSLAKPLASSTASDSFLASVLTGGSAWRSARQGAAATGEFVGLELPPGATLHPRELTVRWVALHWLPAKLAVDYSDDGRTWTTAAVLPVQQPSQPETRKTGVNRWDESFALPASGPHRFWRVRAAEMDPANFFGMERISFR